jgi:hypothetical protein
MSMIHTPSGYASISDKVKFQLRVVGGAFRSQPVTLRVYSEVFLLQDSSPTGALYPPAGEESGVAEGFNGVDFSPFCFKPKPRPKPRPRARTMKRIAEDRRVR